MSKLFPTFAAIAIFSAGALGMAAEAPDYSKEAVVIQSMETKVKFSDSGEREWRQTLSARIQSEAAVRQFGVLSFSYGAENEQVTIEYVRVRKPDGSVVETPESSVQDIATQVAAEAPTYVDLRQKQVPVKALAVGDVLEYSFHSTQQKPEIPGEFWYDQFFVNDSVVLKQTLEISVPKQKYVQVSSPKVKSEMREEGDQRVYLWQYSHLEPSKPDDKKKSTGEDELPKAQITTFRNWAEVGSWWAAIAAPQMAVTPAIQEKANSLTAGLTSDSEKAKALYKYVSMKFRYISISLGAGRYRPHSAAEVMANQYGDCKDKHTLFASLLKASGIQAWPALIGAGVKFDDSVPSPAQFNHVITVLPDKGKYVFLDTTAEVAPFGLLSQGIRDEQALVIPSEGKAFLLKTPIDPPFKTSDTVEVKSSLNADGTLTGRFDFQVTGDSALLLRGVFRQLAPAQWQTLAQQMSYSMSYEGDVSGVDVGGIEDIDAPFHYSYDYSRKNYSDWAEHKITPPMPPIGFGPGDEAEKPKEPFWAGSPGTVTYRASVQLPKGFTMEAPPDTTLTSAIADYSAHYSVKEGTFSAERKLVIKEAKVPLDQWAEYQKLSKGIRDDQAQYVLLSEAEKGSDNNPEAEQLLQRAAVALQAHKVDEARDLIAQAERQNPKQRALWALKSWVAVGNGKREEAITDVQKEVEFHPDEVQAYLQLSDLLEKAGRRDEAIEAARGALRLNSTDTAAVSGMVTLLMRAKRYSEVPPILEKAIAAAPDSYELQDWNTEALLRTGRKEEGLAAAKKLAAANPEPMHLNNLAYYLSDTGTDNTLAKEWSQKAVDQTEQTVAKSDLGSFEDKDLKLVNFLAAEWDTLGWIYFQGKDLDAAFKYVNAAWNLSQQAAEANHLGQIYEQQGKMREAIHTWRLALAADSGDDDSRERLRKAGIFVSKAGDMGAAAAKASADAMEELGMLRTIEIPGLAQQTGSAEFFVLISRQGIEETQIIGESAAFKDAGPAIQSAKYEFPFPDDGPEKIIRRGVLSCSAYTKPNCQFTMLLPATTRVEERRAQPPGSGEVSGSSGVRSPPKLLSKVEPEYTQAALDAKLEGAVVLSIVVNQQGVPENVSIIKSLGMGLDENAKACVLKWRFDPGTKDGKPVRVRATVEVRFRIVKGAH
jgi:TonB family protein